MNLFSGLKGEGLRNAWDTPIVPFPFQGDLNEVETQQILIKQVKEYVNNLCGIPKKAD